MLQDLSKARPVYVGDLPRTSNPKPRATDKVKPRRRRGQFSTWRMEMLGKAGIVKWTKMFKLWLDEIHMIRTVIISTWNMRGLNMFAKCVWFPASLNSFKIICFYLYSRAMWNNSMMLRHRSIWEKHSRQTQKGIPTMRQPSPGSLWLSHHPRSYRNVGHMLEMFAKN